jgi:hypothetical protein
MTTQGGGVGTEVSSVPVRQGRLRRVPGGRPRQVIVRLTADEHASLHERAVTAEVSVQRYLVEAGLSGSAAAATEVRQARRDAERALLVLTSIANNVNQLAKWANTNRVLPDTFPAALDDIRRATAVVADATVRLCSVPEGGH